MDGRGGEMDYVGDGLFPARAEDLARWLEGVGPSVLGRSANHWLTVIEYSGGLALSGDGPAECQDFRGVALMALSEARRKTKNLVRPVRHLRGHLDDARLRAVDQWLDLLPLLP
jgi:hypothetical protein